MKARAPEISDQQTARSTRRWLAGVVLGGLCVPAVHAQYIAPQTVDQATVISDHRGQQVPRDLHFVDEQGTQVTLGDYFQGQRPVILNLGYFGCPALCGVVLNGLVDGLRGVDLRIGRDFEVLTVSIDPNEGPELAAKKKQATVEAYGQPAAAEHWHFLTGSEDQIKPLAEAAGFGYQWNPFGKQWDHSAGIFLLSPDGEVTQALQGASYDPRDLRLAIVEASQGKVGSFYDRILLTCYGYDPSTRTYSLAVWTVIRLGGVFTLLFIGVTFFLLWRRERRHRQVAAASSVA